MKRRKNNEICKYCKRPKGDHLVNTLRCPLSRKSVAGYPTYHKTRIFKSK